MATLLLFANLRETAGTSTVELPGNTVGQVVTAAVESYGDDFAAGVGTARVWVNGDPADDDTPVSTADEIALIPPVSGGTSRTQNPSELLDYVAVPALVAAVAIANWISVQWFAFAMVGIGIAWLWDLRDTLAMRGIRFQMIPAMVAVALAVNGAYGWGQAGFAGGMALGTVACLIWVVLDTSMRTLDRVALLLLLATVASLGTGALVLVRLDGSERVTFFIALVLVAGAASWGVARLPNDTFASLDGNLVGLLGALFVGAVAGLGSDAVDLPTALIAAAFAGAGLVAGRTFGSMVRSGAVVLTERSPGMLTTLDGPAIAATMFWAALTLFG
jgi:molybdopterin converting factor small subunit